MYTVLKKFLLTSLFLTVLASVATASSGWTINDIDGDKSPEDVSNVTKTAQMVEVEDNDGDPVNESRMDDSTWKFEYDYGGTVNSMTHLEGGYWYAEFTANQSKTDLEYQIVNTDPDGGEVNTSETLNFKNLTVDIQNDFDTLKAGNDVFVEVNVTDENADEREENADVYLTITNGSEVSSTELGYNNGFYTNSVTIPEYYGSNVLIHANASESSMGGSNSQKTSIYPQTTGKISYLNASGGCNNESFFTSCERGAQIETGFNVTVLSADSVRLQLKAPNTDGSMDYLENISMTENNGIWESSFDIPDLNTSKYDKEIQMEYNITEGGENFLKKRNVSYKSYTIRDKSDASVFQGDNYLIQILFGKRYSLEALDTSRISEANITITDSEGTEIENLVLDDFAYNEDNDLFENEISIGSDAAEGNYDTDIEALNLYDERKTRDSGFSVNSLDASFNLSSTDLDYNYSTIGLKEEEVKITNRLSQELEIEASFSDGLDDIATFNSGSNLTLQDSETVNASISFDLEETGDHVGDLTLTGSENNYTKTVDISIEGPECSISNGTLCLERDSRWVNVTADQVQSYTEDVEISNLGDSSAFVSTDIQGQVSEYLTLDPSSPTISDSQVIEFNYTPKLEGEFNGNVTFSADGNDLLVKTKFVSNVENLQAGMSADTSINLAGAVQGTTVNRQITVTNTGDVDITGLSASSSTFTSSIENVEIPAGESRTVSISFENIQTTEGSVTVQGQSSEGELTAEIAVTGEFLDYESKISDLRTRINNLQSEAQTEDTLSSLDQASSELNNIESLYDSGQTTQAESQFSQLQTEVNSIESSINSGSSGSEPPSNNGQTDGTDSDSETDDNSSEDGGGVLIIIAVVVFVLLIAGFIVYTSYIPEPGDPLYDYLGEE